MSLVIDSQVHVWLPETPGRPWPPGGRQWRETLHRSERITDEVLLHEMAGAGVGRAVLVPPLFEGHRNDYALGCARAHPERFRVMARVDLARPDLPEAVESLAADPHVAGVRLVFLPADAGTVTGPNAARFWPVAQDHDLPVMVHAPGQLADVAGVAAAHPGLRLAIDHLGLSGTRTDHGIGSEVADLLGLAALPQVSVKLSALPCYSTEPFPHPALHGPIRRVLQAFGPGRTFWGSDLSRLRGSYRESVDLVREHLGLTPAARAAVLGESLARWLSWG
jgi:L-fuconolactonase